MRGANHHRGRGTALLRSTARTGLAMGALAAALTGSASAQLLEGPPGTIDANRPFVPTTAREVELVQRFADFNAAVVGEEIITHLDVLRWQSNPQFEDPTPERADLTPLQAREERYVAALTELMELQLKVQGGRAQGYEPEIIRNARDSDFERLVRQYGGPQRATELFATWGFTPETFRDYLEERLVSNLWEDSMNGRAPGATGRNFVDANIRPGQLYARYRAHADSPDPAMQEIVGKSDGRVSTRVLTVLIGPNDDAAERQHLTGLLRERIADGTIEMESAIAEYAAPSYRGDASVTKDALIELYAPSLAEQFPAQAVAIEEVVRQGAVGDLSPVMAFLRDGEPIALAIFQITKRSPKTDATPFANLELQRELRKVMTEEAEKVRIEQGLAELVLSSHVSPPELRNEFLRRGERRLSR